MTTKHEDPYINGDIKVAGDNPRALDELLKLETYQGASDDEIKLIIAYKEMVSFKKGFNAGMDKSVRDAYERIALVSSEQMSEAARAYSNALAGAPAFEVCDE